MAGPEKNTRGSYLREYSIMCVLLYVVFVGDSFFPFLTKKVPFSSFFTFLFISTTSKIVYFIIRFYYRAIKQKSEIQAKSEIAKKLITGGPGEFILIYVNSNNSSLIYGQQALLSTHIVPFICYSCSKKLANSNWTVTHLYKFLKEALC